MIVVEIIFHFFSSGFGILAPIIIVIFPIVSSIVMIQCFHVPAPVVHILAWLPGMLLCWFWGVKLNCNKKSRTENDETIHLVIKYLSVKK